MVKVKKAYQRHTTTCGAVAVATITSTPYVEVLKHYAKVTARNLAKHRREGTYRHNVKYSGSWGKHVTDTLHRMGVRTGRTLAFKEGQRLRDIKFPCIVIVLWRDKASLERGSGHWIVWDGKRVHNLFYNKREDLHREKRGLYTLHQYIRVYPNES